MNLTRAIAVSFLAHAAILAYAFVPYESMSADLNATPSLAGIVVDYERAEMDFSSPLHAERESSEEGSHSELVAMDLEAGLDGDSETTSEAKSDPARPEPDRNAAPEPSEESASEASDDEPDTPEESADSPGQMPVVDKDRTSPDGEEETDEAEPEIEPKPETEPTEAEASGDESGGENGEERLAGRGTAGTSDSGGGADGGYGTGAGGGGTGDEGSGRSDIDRGKLIRDYTRTLHRRLAEEKYYPRAARRAGVEGTVEIAVTIDADGVVLGVELHESSGHEILDQAALDIMRSIEKVPAPPEALAWSKKRLNVPIPYRLESRG